MPPEVQRRALELAGYEVPVVELTGAGDGPRLTVLAGVHGCEYAPMAAVRRWTRALAERELRGRVRAVPVLNLPAFRARIPFVVPDDGKNLNRCFPGDRGGYCGAVAGARRVHATHHRLRRPGRRARRRHGRGAGTLRALRRGAQRGEGRHSADQIEHQI